VLPDGDAPGAPALARPSSAAGPLPGAALWRSRRFVTLAAATFLGLFAQIDYGLQLCGSLVLLAAGGVSVPLLLLGVVLFGLGLGNATSLPPLIVQQDFAPADTARAVALVTACSQACYAFAPVAFGALRDLSATTGASVGNGAPLLFTTAALVQLAAAGTVMLGCLAPARPAVVRA